MAVDLIEGGALRLCDGDALPDERERPLDVSEAEVRLAERNEAESGALGRGPALLGDRHGALDRLDRLLPLAPLGLRPAQECTTTTRARTRSPIRSAISTACSAWTSAASGSPL